MDPLTNLRAGDWSEVLVRYARSLAAHAPAIDRLDRFHGGSADTGTGSAMRDTLASIVGRLAEPPRDFSALATAMRVSPGEARGPSGRLLGGFLAGMADALVNVDALDATGLAVTLEAGAEAMTGPGTTGFEPVCAVATHVAAVALATADANGTLVEVALAAADGGLDALELTAADDSEQSEEGVVDPAAAGLVVLFDILVGVVHGEEHDPGPFGEDDPEEDLRGSVECRYVVRLDLEAPPSGVDHLAIIWRSLGESASIVASASTLVDEPHRWRATVATDDIGAVIEAAIEVGRPSAIVVEDLRRDRDAYDRLGRSR